MQGPAHTETAQDSFEFQGSGIFHTGAELCTKQMSSLIPAITGSFKCFTYAKPLSLYRLTKSYGHKQW